MPPRWQNSFIFRYVDESKACIGIRIMGEKIASLWYWLCGHRSEKDKQRLRSLIPMILYGALIMYGIIYLSILNTVNRFNPGPAVKTWWGGDSSETIAALNKEQREKEESYKGLRKRVAGGR